MTIEQGIVRARPGWLGFEVLYEGTSVLAVSARSVRLSGEKHRCFRFESAVLEIDGTVGRVASSQTMYILLLI